MGLVSEKKIFNFQFLVVYLVVYYLTKMGKSVNPDCPGSKQTVVLEDSVVGGDINLPGDLCLFGKILGNITAGGRVEVRQGALVTGHVRCRELYVEGVVEGNVETRSLIIFEFKYKKRSRGADSRATRHKESAFKRSIFSFVS